jgi:hypothetical protein
MGASPTPAASADVQLRGFAFGLNAVMERCPACPSTAAIDVPWLVRPLPRAAIAARSLASTRLEVLFEPTGRPRDAAIAFNSWRSIVPT